jgi:hypothetical protein
MAYDDDDDLFSHDFDFVDDDDDEGEDAEEEDSELEESPKPKPKPRKQPAGRSRSSKEKDKEPPKPRGRSSSSKGKEKDAPREKDKEKPDEKDDAEAPSTRAPKRGRPASKRESGGTEADAPLARIEPPHAPPPPPPVPALEPAPVGYILGDEPLDDDPELEAEPPAPVGPQADHLVHIYEYGELKRTIARKFTDEEAVSFAEEYTRSNKAYGRYAVAMPEDEQPSPTFAGAARG